MRDKPLYDCSPDCRQGEVHEDSGCEGCHDPDAPHLVDFGTWRTSYCEACARQLRRDGNHISHHGKELPPDQLRLGL